MSAVTATTGLLCGLEVRGRRAGSALGLFPAFEILAGPHAALRPRAAEAKAAPLDETADVAVLLARTMRLGCGRPDKQGVDLIGVADEFRARAVPHGWLGAATKLCALPSLKRPASWGVRYPFAIACIAEMAGAGRPLGSNQ